MTTKQMIRENGEMSVVEAQVTICPHIKFAERIVLKRFTARVICAFRSSALVFFAVTAKSLFSRYWLQALFF